MDPEICSLIKCVFVALLFVRFFLVVVLGLLHQYDQSLTFLRGLNELNTEKNGGTLPELLNICQKYAFKMYISQTIEFSF